MLGKQWLNRYAVGSIADRSHYRQRKLDGMDAWCFNAVMESLPLTLQIALLLLGSALSRYLWELQPTVSRVTVGVTSLGVLLYLVIVVAGSLYTSCPYQTPASQIIRRIWRKFFRGPFTGSLVWLRQSIGKSYSLGTAWHWGDSWVWILLHPLFLPVTLVADCCLVMGYLTSCLYQHSKTSTVYLHQSIHHNHRASQALNANGHTKQELISYILDSHCIAWILETSLVKAVHVIALKFLATLPIFGESNPAVIIRCLDLLFSSVDVANGNRAVVLPGSEDLANAAATAFIHIHTQLRGIDSSILEDLRRKYRSQLRRDITFDQRSPTIISILHLCLHGTSRRGLFPSWERYKMSPLTHEVICKALIVHSEQQRHVRMKVPRWILRFVLHSLSQDIFPPDAVVHGCLRIVSDDLGGATTTTYKRYAEFYSASHPPDLPSV